MKTYVFGFRAPVFIPLLVLFGRDVWNPRALTLALEFLDKYFGFFLVDMNYLIRLSWLIINNIIQKF